MPVDKTYSVLSFLELLRPTSKKKQLENYEKFLERLLSEFTFIPHLAILKLCHLVFRIPNLLVNGTILYIDNKVSVKTNLLLNVFFRNLQIYKS